MNARFGVATIAGLLLTITSCSGKDVLTRTVGHHTFNVPRRNLVTEKIPWLPSSQSAALIFTANPESPLQDLWIVTLEPAATTCHPPVAPASDQLAEVCSKESAGGILATIPERDLEKVPPDRDATQWEYRLKRRAGEDRGRVVASCFALSTPGRGLCTCLLKYDDLIVSVGIGDNEVHGLSEIQATIRNLLQAWEYEK